jgi:hypothetical protein
MSLPPRQDGAISSIREFAGHGVLPAMPPQAPHAVFVASSEPGATLNSGRNGAHSGDDPPIVVYPAKIAAGSVRTSLSTGIPPEDHQGNVLTVFDQVNGTKSFSLQRRISVPASQASTVHVAILVESSESKDQQGGSVPCWSVVSAGDGVYMVTVRREPRDSVSKANAQSSSPSCFSELIALHRCAVAQQRDAAPVVECRFLSTVLIAADDSYIYIIAPYEPVSASSVTTGGIEHGRRNESLLSQGPMSSLAEYCLNFGGDSQEQRLPEHVALRLFRQIVQVSTFDLAAAQPLYPDRFPLAPLSHLSVISLPIPNLASTYRDCSDDQK